MEIIHPPPTVFLASHCQDPLCLTLARLPCLSHLPFFLLYAHALTHTHTHGLTDSGNTDSLYLHPPPFSFGITSLSASLPVIHEQAEILLCPSLHNLPPSLFCLCCALGEPAASGPHRVQREGQEGPAEARKGEHHLSASGQCYCFTIKTQQRIVL